MTGGQQVSEEVFLACCPLSCSSCSITIYLQACRPAADMMIRPGAFCMDASDITSACMHVRILHDTCSFKKGIAAISKASGRDMLIDRHFNLIR